MTVALEISPEMELALNAKAELHELALSDYLFALFEADIENYYSLPVEDLTALHQSLADLHAGDKGISLEEYRVAVMATIERLKQQEVKAAL